MSNLGALLARNQALEADKNTEAMAQKAARAGVEAARKFDLVQSFLATAKTHITTQIQAGEPTVEIFIGSNGSRSEHVEVGELLANKVHDAAAGEGLKRSSHPYYCLWRDFSAWASSEGLLVSFDYDYDGGGLYSWHLLRAKPAPQAVRGINRI